MAKEHLAHEAGARSAALGEQKRALDEKVREAEAEQGVMLDALLTRFGVMQAEFERRSAEQQHAYARAFGVQDQLELERYDRYLGATAAPGGGATTLFSAQLHGMQESVAQMQLKRAKVKRAHLLRAAYLK